MNVVHCPPDAEPASRPAAGEVHVWAMPHGPGEDRSAVAGRVEEILDRYPGPAGPGAISRRPGEKPSYHRRGRRAGLEFSVGHAREVSLVAVADTHVGVDVEHLRSGPWQALPRHALAAQEQRALAGLGGAERDRALLTYWVRKEAILKCSGLGLAVDPRCVEVSEPWSPPRVAAVPPELGASSAWLVADLELPGCVAAVAVCEPSTLRWPL